MSEASSFDQIIEGEVEKRVDGIVDNRQVDSKVDEEVDGKRVVPSSSDTVAPPAALPMPTDSAPSNADLDNGYILTLWLMTLIMTSNEFVWILTDDIDNDFLWVRLDIMTDDIDNDF